MCAYGFRNKEREKIRGHAIDPVQQDNKYGEKYEKEDARTRSDYQSISIRSTLTLKPKISASIFIGFINYICLLSFFGKERMTSAILAITAEIWHFLFAEYHWCPPNYSLPFSTKKSPYYENLLPQRRYSHESSLYSFSDHRFSQQITNGILIKVRQFSYRFFWLNRDRETLVVFFFIYRNLLEKKDHLLILIYTMICSTNTHMYIRWPWRAENASLLTQNTSISFCSCLM